MTNSTSLQLGNPPNPFDSLAGPLRHFYSQIPRAAVTAGMGGHEGVGGAGELAVFSPEDAVSEAFGEEV
ncbi:hypothetical protein [Streptomyces catenulae]|uniref:Uncharacterized protein n=1 Tax=Streptomyces catenulae TaxID=66875 RepID=A0ABV2Z3E1_9ACTN|nr:hypothetical protein [Streptomyces catenulae]